MRSDSRNLLTSGRSPRESGTVLIFALALTVVVGTLLIGTLTTTVLQAKTMRHALDMTYAMGLAEGATEIAQFEMVEQASNFETPETSGVAFIGGQSVPWTATELGSPIQRFAADGVQTISQPYEITASWNEGMASARISRIVDLTFNPIFQYAVFYDSLLEISPGPDMTISGRVHANGDLYLDSTRTLTLDADYIQSTGEIIRGRFEDTTRSGSVMIRESQGTNYVEITDTTDSLSTDWTQSALASWAGGVKSGAHGVEAIGVPELPAIEAGGYYEENAGLRIVNTQAYDSDGLMISMPAGVITEKTMYDAREGKNVKVTEIDLGALAKTAFYPTNGLIYARRTDASVSTPNGVRLTNGASLATPLTVVSENPAYIHGDFNTVDKKPASVIADAVNLLSNSWNDSRTVSSGVPWGSNTTYNVSMITGQVTGVGQDSGGFHNLPRLHENWRGRTLTILGSFACLFESQYARAFWRLGGVYSPPSRVWSFDSDLLDPALLPPYTPSGVSMRRVLWDDHEPVHFKVEDSRLSLFPTTPVYDPWTYDGTFMGKVIDDPNFYIHDGDREVDYADKVESEEPDTADRNTETESEQKTTAAAPVIAEAVRAAERVESNADTALAWLADGNLMKAEQSANMASSWADDAQAAYDLSGKHPDALEALQRARAAEAKAWNAIDAARKP